MSNVARMPSEQDPTGKRRLAESEDYCTPTKPRLLGDSDTEEKKERADGTDSCDSSRNKDALFGNAPLLFDETYGFVICTLCGEFNSARHPTSPTEVADMSREAETVWNHIIDAHRKEGSTQIQSWESSKEDFVKLFTDIVHKKRSDYGDNMKDLFARWTRSARTKRITVPIPGLQSIKGFVCPCKQYAATTICDVEKHQHDDKSCDSSKSIANCELLRVHFCDPDGIAKSALCRVIKFITSPTQMRPISTIEGQTRLDTKLAQYYKLILELNPNTCGVCFALGRFTDNCHTIDKCPKAANVCFNCFMIGCKDRRSCVRKTTPDFCYNCYLHKSQHCWTGQQGGLGEACTWQRTQFPWFFAMSVFHQKKRCNLPIPTNTREFAEWALAPTGERMLNLHKFVVIHVGSVWGAAPPGMFQDIDI